MPDTKSTDAALFEFGARLTDVKSPVGPLGSVVKAEAQREPWALFGRIAEAMRERGCITQFRCTKRRHEVSIFKPAKPRRWFTKTDPNPALAALKAARAALGDEA